MADSEEDKLEAPIPERRPKPAPSNPKNNETARTASNLYELVKTLEESKKLNGIHKHKDSLIKNITELADILNRRETQNFDKIDRFKHILEDIHKEEKDTERHIERMEKANIFKRPFIKKNVAKKFKEIAQRVMTINRAVNVFEINEKANKQIMDDKIKSLQITVDGLDAKIKQKVEERRLHNLARQPSRLTRHRSTASAKAQNSQRDEMKEGADKGVASKSEKQLLDAN